VLLYGTMQISQMRVVIDAFEKKYPFLKVKHYRTNSDKLVQKVFTEVRAGHHLADVYQIRGTRLFRLQRAGILSHFESPERKYIRDIYKDTEGYWAGVYANLRYSLFDILALSALTPKSSSLLPFNKFSIAASNCNPVNGLAT